MGSLLASQAAQYGLLLGVVLLCAVMLRMTYRRQRAGRESSGETARRQISKKLREQSDVKDDIRALMVQLQDLSRQINAQIDTRFAKLEASIRTADERIRTLGQLGRATAGQQPVDIVLADAEPPEPPPQAPSPTESVDAQRKVVCELADLGKNVVQIAKETGRSPGEIELILSLRDRRA